MAVSRVLLRNGTRDATIVSPIQYDNHIQRCRRIYHYRDSMTRELDHYARSIQGEPKLSGLARCTLRGFLLLVYVGADADPREDVEALWMVSRSCQDLPPLVVESGGLTPYWLGPKPPCCKAHIPNRYASCGGNTESGVWGRRSQVEQCRPVPSVRWRAMLQVCLSSVIFQQILWVKGQSQRGDTSDRFRRYKLSHEAVQVVGHRSS